MQIKDETYERINVFIGELRIELKRPVSVDEAIKRLLNFKKKKPSRFAGGWEMDEKEAEELKKELKGVWKKWELRSIRMFSLTF